MVSNKSYDSNHKKLLPTRMVIRPKEIQFLISNPKPKLNCGECHGTGMMNDGRKKKEIADEVLLVLNYHVKNSFPSGPTRITIFELTL